MLNISLNVLLFHHFNIDQDVQQSYRYHGKKTKTKRNKNKTFFNYGDSSQCPFFSFWIYIIFISFSLWRQNLREKNNTSCKTCLVINLEIKIIQFRNFLSRQSQLARAFSHALFYLLRVHLPTGLQEVLRLWFFLAAICRPG